MTLTPLGKKGFPGDAISNRMFFIGTYLFKRDRFPDLLSDLVRQGMEWNHNP